MCGRDAQRGQAPACAPACTPGGGEGGTPRGGRTGASESGQVSSAQTKNGQKCESSWRETGAKRKSGPLLGVDTAPFLEDLPTTISISCFRVVGSFFFVRSFVWGVDMKAPLGMVVFGVFFFRLLFPPLPLSPLLLEPPSSCATDSSLCSPTKAKGRGGCLVSSYASNLATASLSSPSSAPLPPPLPPPPHMYIKVVGLLLVCWCCCGCDWKGEKYCLFCAWWPPCC